MPDLITIAGPNGAGKSYFSDFYLSEFGFDILSFDYDIEFAKRWKEFSYDPYVEDGVRDATNEYFNTSIDNAIKNNESFSFQTNYHSDYNLDIINKFKKAGYKTTLLYFFVNDIKELQTRVSYRHVIKKLHYVPEHVIRERYDLGIKMVNETQHKFDNFIILDNSISFVKPHKEILKPVYVRTGNHIEISKKCSLTLISKFDFL